MSDFPEMWVIMAFVAAVIGLPLIEIFNRIEVWARVTMTPIEKPHRPVALAYETILKNN
jgi:hypothetical protein